MTPRSAAAANPGEEVVVAEQVPDEGERMRRQLLVFARDLNRIYHDERTRAAELEDALHELEEAYRATVHTLAFVVEARDPNTKAHLDRASEYAKALAERVAPELTQDQGLLYGFMLHDIGKVGIPERILGKPGPLTAEEWDIIRTHPIIGGQILGPIRAFRNAIPIVEGHHERWDGGGYPRGVSGDDIAIGARIFSIVDTFDAMTSDRPYRRALRVDDALAEIDRSAGEQFDPDLAAHFVKMMEEGDAPIPDRGRD